MKAIIMHCSTVLQPAPRKMPDTEQLFKNVCKMLKQKKWFEVIIIARFQPVYIHCNPWDKLRTQDKSEQ